MELFLIIAWRKLLFFWGWKKFSGLFEDFAFRPKTRVFALNDSHVYLDSQVLPCQGSTVGKLYLLYLY